MFHVPHFWDDESMVLSKPVCDSRLLIAGAGQRVSPGTVTDGANRTMLTPRPGILRSQPGPGTAFDVEPYSCATLRPLTAACVFRDCSLRRQTPILERRACRTLMRHAAIKWRQGLPMGDL